MHSQFLFLLAAGLLPILAPAQTKSVALPGGPPGMTLGVYPPDPLVRPTGTAVLLCGPDQTNALVNACLQDLSKVGCVGFLLRHPAAADIAKAFDYIQANAAEYKLHKEKVGLLALGGAGQISAAAAPFAFLGLIDPVELPKLKATTAPVYLEAAKSQSTDVLRFYTKGAKSGLHVDLHLHEQTLPESAKSTSWIDWLGSLGYLKPLSEEKTEALKSKEAWENLAKFYDDRLHKDWAWLGRYADDNAKLSGPAAGENRVVFMGDSITDGWIDSDPEFFKANHYLDRGIGGQTTPQMLVRFREDVVNLQPKVVLLLAGINDIAENTGPSKLENVAGNLFSMCELAQAHGCKPILCSVLPAAAFPWHPGINPIPLVLKLNAMLQEYARAHQLGYLDYYSAVVAANQGMKPELTKDGVHPTLAGYKVLEPLAQAAIEKALAE